MTAPLLDGRVIKAESRRAATRHLFGGGNYQAAASRNSRGARATDSCYMPFSSSRFGIRIRNRRSPVRNDPAQDSSWV